MKRRLETGRTPRRGAPRARRARAFLRPGGLAEAVTRAALAVGIVAALALAGCLAPNDAPTPARQICDNRTATCPAPPPPPGSVQGPIDPAKNASFGLAPVWEVRDWWSFRASDGSNVKVVVTNAGSSYVLQPTDNRTALMEAIFDFSTLGNIGTDLSGDQGGTRVKYFDFPLEENKTWGLTVDGLSLRAMSKIDKNEWLVTATDGNQTQLVYRYSPTTKWFTSIDWAYQDFALQLDGSGQDYVGDVYRTTIDPKFTYLTGSPPPGSFAVAPGTSAVAVKYEWTGNAGFAASARFVDPKNTANVPFPDVTCTAACQGFGVAVYPGHAGTWAGSVSSTPQGVLRVTVFAATDQVTRLG